MSVKASSEESLLLPLLQTGAGTHDTLLYEYLGSHPLKQYAPTPHWPYAEQHGESDGQLLFDPQLGPSAVTVRCNDVQARADIIISRRYRPIAPVVVKRCRYQEIDYKHLWILQGRMQSRPGSRLMRISSDGV